MEGIVFIILIYMLCMLCYYACKNSNKEFDKGYESGQRDARKKVKTINYQIKERELGRYKKISEDIINDLENIDNRLKCKKQ